MNPAAAHTVLFAVARSTRYPRLLRSRHRVVAVGRLLRSNCLTRSDTSCGVRTTDEDASLQTSMHHSFCAGVREDGMADHCYFLATMTLQFRVHSKKTGRILAYAGHEGNKGI